VVSCASRGEGGGALCCGGKLDPLRYSVKRAHNSPRPPLSNKPLRAVVGAVVVERVWVVGRCVVVTCAHPVFGGKLS